MQSRSLVATENNSSLQCIFLYALSITTTTTTNLNNSCMFIGCVDFDPLLDVVSCHAVVDLSNSCNDSNKCNSDNRNTTPDQCSICSLQFYIWLKPHALPARARAVSSTTEDKEAALEEKVLAVASCLLEFYSYYYYLYHISLYCRCY